MIFTLDFLNSTKELSPHYNTHGGSAVLSNLRGNSLIGSMQFFSYSL